MLCSNQEMIRTVLPLLAETPVLCDWLPWNHTFGGNHNVGLVLYNGGTLYIDDGKPMPGAFDTTIAEPARDSDHASLQRAERLRPARAALARRRWPPQPLLRPSEDAVLRRGGAPSACRRRHPRHGAAKAAARIPLVTGLGATESAPFALCAGDSDFSGGRIGVPAPGVELKLAPVGRQIEARLRGPNITPGYWRDAGADGAAFDDEGYYKMGDALAFFDPGDPAQGFTFEGRLVGGLQAVHRHLGPRRAAAAGLLAHFGDLRTTS